MKKQKNELDLFRESLEDLSITELTVLESNLSKKWKQLDWKPARGGYPLSSEEKEEKNMLTKKLVMVTNKISGIKKRR